MTYIEKTRISVESITRTDTDELRFRGEGELWQEANKWHIQYTAKDSEGNRIESQLHVGMGRIAVVNQGYKMLLYPGHTTTFMLGVETGSLAFEVKTEQASFQWDGENGEIQMKYTLLSGGREASKMEIRIQLRRV